MINFTSRCAKGVGIALVLLLPILAEAKTEQQKQFQKARKALRSGDVSTFNTLKKSLKNYPLAFHLEYDALRRQLSKSPAKVSKKRLVAFAKTSPDPVLTRRVLRQYEKHLVGGGQWSNVLSLYSLNNGLTPGCVKLKARWKTGQLKQFDEEARAQWEKPTRHSGSCAYVFKRLEKQSPVTVQMVWQRIYAAMDKKKIAIAKSTGSYLSKRDRALLEVWTKGHQNPKKYVFDSRIRKDTATNRRIVWHLLDRWARKDIAAARNAWAQIKGRYKFSAPRHYALERKLALRLAWRHKPGAHKALRALPAAGHNEESRAWLVRSALLKEDWGKVSQALKRLTPEERAEESWQYWRARADEAQGRKQTAQKRYETLANKASFHGFLAADRLKRDYNIQQLTAPVDQKRRAHIQTLPAMRRAKEYHALGMSVSARRHWLIAIKGMSEPQLVAAADLAREWKWYDRAILTIAKTQHQSDLRLRFPMPYKDNIRPHSEKHQLDSAWIYGVMRRESAFMHDVRSGVGATGLMQLMPKTAQYVGKKMGRKVRKQDLVLPDLNIALGSYYLRSVLDRFDNHPVLATAAYNAGPGSVNRWLPKGGKRSADIWIDTIPYDETRRYVRAVLSYTAIFEWRMQKPVTRLIKKMPDIQPASAG